MLKLYKKKNHIEIYDYHHRLAKLNLKTFTVDYGWCGMDSAVL